METIHSLIDSYGYLAVFIGTFLEGETVLATAGLAAQRGLLDLHLVILVALTGGFLGDQTFFYLGRFYGKRILARFPSLGARAQRLDEMLHRHHVPLIVGVRFMYGFRIVGPLVLGSGRVSGKTFFVCNLLGACMWAVLVAGAGYFFGEALELVLADMKYLEIALAVLLVVIGAAIWSRTRRKQ